MWGEMIITGYLQAIPHACASNTCYHDCLWSSPANTQHKAGKIQYLAKANPLNTQDNDRGLCCRITLRNQSQVGDPTETPKH